MRPSELTTVRLRNQGLLGSELRSPAEVVARLGAMQAQDRAAALWAIGARFSGGTLAAVEKAVADRAIVRTWPMRGTLHFVAAEDVRWMLELLTPRIIARSASRAKELELDARIFRRAEKLFGQALKSGRALVREEMMSLLEAAGILTKEQRGYHILWRLAQEQVLCFGPMEGKQPTFVLLDEWLPATRRLDREAALAELARRYFTGHGPATVQDLAWWSGLTLTEAKAAQASVATELVAEPFRDQRYWSPASVQAARDSSVHLLPGFDEYLLGYTDRTEILAAEHAPQIVPGNNGMFMPMLVVGGQIVGTWKRVVSKRRVEVIIQPFKSLSKSASRAAEQAAKRYGQFLGLPVECV